MNQTTEDLIHELTADLPPTRPMGRLRDTLLAALGISLPFVAYWLLSEGIRHQFKLGKLPDGLYLWVAISLVLFAAGGLIAGLAAAIPGREEAFRLGRALFRAGIALGLVLLGYHWLSGSASITESSRSSIPCATYATMLAIPSALWVARYVVRGAALNLQTALFLAFAGATAVAAGAVHLTCPHPGPLHQVLGHGLAPVVGGAAILIGVSIARFFAPRVLGAANS